MGTSILYTFLFINLTIILGGAFFLIKCFHSPLKGEALIRTGVGGTKIVLEKGLFVFPYMHNLEKLDLTIKTFTLRQTVVCKDQTAAIMEVLFYLRVNHDVSSIRLAASEIGSKNSFNKAVLKEIFEPKLIEALQHVAATVDYTTLQTKSPALKLKILETVGVHLNGYILEDCIVNTVDAIPTL